MKHPKVFIGAIGGSKSQYHIMLIDRNDFYYRGLKSAGGGYANTKEQMQHVPKRQVNGTILKALSETRFADEGQLTETGAVYTFFWSGHKREECREAGVGFAIKSNLLKNLETLPKGINDRLMTMQQPLTDKKHATLISAFAPIMTNPDEVKDKFYEELDSVISSVPTANKLLLFGDFNARVGVDHQAWEGVIGKHSIGKCNSNGLLLLQSHSFN
ncbi:uncharacterized protein LOC134766349 [Penaeus indicus]|uniref:uncharacterized protein LOC134766349 n=1 Tax=Penaeus indicus TaxID=29960 RepID=UPI00300D619D